MKTTQISALHSNREILMALIARHGDNAALVATAAELIAADARLSGCVAASKCGEKALASDNALDVIWAYDDALEELQAAAAAWEHDEDCAAFIRRLARVRDRFESWMHPDRKVA